MAPTALESPIISPRLREVAARSFDQWEALIAERLRADGWPEDSGELVYRGPNVMMGYAHEPADLALPKTVETLRTGYRWKGRVLRPAMVRTRG